MKLRKLLVTCMGAALIFSTLTACSKEKASDVSNGGTNKGKVESQTGDNQSVDNDVWTKAKTNTYEPYPELVEYTIGVTVKPDVAYPEGSTDTVENSAFTRFLKSKLNIQNSNLFEAADGEDYRTKVSMAITSGEIPDIMSVNYDELRSLVENDMIEDLTESYNNTAGDLMKSIYDSGNNRSLDMATFDGKLYAIPTTAIDSGAEMLWVRKDWMDKLGISEPKTLDDVKNMILQFIEKDPGGNGKGNTIGLPLVVNNDNFLYGGYSSAYRVNNIFSYFGAMPEQWIDDGTGKAVYGSIQPEMKEGIQLIADWYQAGVIDKEMVVRTYDDIKALVTDGKIGAYFCGWWAPYDLAGSYELNPDVEWVSYIMPTGSDGKVTMWTGNPNQDNYFVVRKGFEHPELLVKAKSLTLDYNQGDAIYSDTSAEAKEYAEWVQKGYGIEFIGGFDWFDAAERAHVNIQDSIDGKRDPNTLSAYENSLYNSVVEYNESVAKGEKPSKSSWIDYNARIAASGLMYRTDVNIVNPVFFSQTESMPLMWESLKMLERTTVLKIVTGELGIEAFDDFVTEWKEIGGDQITAEVNEAIQ